MACLQNEQKAMKAALAFTYILLQSNWPGIFTVAKSSLHAASNRRAFSSPCQVARFAEKVLSDAERMKIMYVPSVE